MLGEVGPLILAQRKTGRKSGVKKKRLQREHNRQVYNRNQPAASTAKSSRWIPKDPKTANRVVLPSYGLGEGIELGDGLLPPSFSSVPDTSSSKK